MRTYAVAALVAAGTMAPGVAVACSCPADDSARDHVDRTDVIFEGVTIDSRRILPGEIPRQKGQEKNEGDADLMRTRFQVTRTRKGQVPQTIVIFHPDNVCCICGLTYEPGRSYKVFASHVEGIPDMLFTDLCGTQAFDWEDYLAVFKSVRTDD